VEVGAVEEVAGAAGDGESGEGFPAGVEVLTGVLLGPEPPAVGFQQLAFEASSSADMRASRAGRHWPVSARVAHHGPAHGSRLGLWVVGSAARVRSAAAARGRWVAAGEDGIPESGQQLLDAPASRWLPEAAAKLLTVRRQGGEVGDAARLEQRGFRVGRQCGVERRGGRPRLDSRGREGAGGVGSSR